MLNEATANNAIIVLRNMTVLQLSSAKTSAQNNDTVNAMPFQDLKRVWQDIAFNSARPEAI
jgi:hypothetical protein